MNMSKPVQTIAIDGTAASGKGTLAKALATHLGFDYLDTGKLYRAVGLAALEAGLMLEASEEAEIAALARALELPVQDNKALHEEQTAHAASVVAAMAEVRTALLARQRDFAANPPGGKGAVLDGRDIGTVILPDADIKFYVDARAKVRAERRFMELSGRGEVITREQVLADIQSRDARDKNRPVAPLKPAENAILVDSSDKNAQTVLSEVLSKLRDR
ncbi:MAG: (d)CMP kinase [Candidatus Puniceispirillaceae bacterium]